MSDRRAPNEVDRQLGQRVRARRLDIGMSQERLANLLGVTFQQVQKYERGVNRIAASRLLDIAAALDMKAAAFFVGLDRGLAAQGNQRAYDAVLSTADGVALASLFVDATNPRTRRRIVAMVRTLSESEVG